MDDNYYDDLLNSFETLLDDVNAGYIRKTHKMFASLDKQVSLQESLTTYTKTDLDNIRKNLNISGISSLNKTKLTDALDIEIKKLLPEIMKKLVHNEYILMKNMLKHKGILKYKDKFSDDFYHLRALGILGCFKDSVGDNYIFVPSDLIENVNTSINTLSVVAAIKRNDKVSKLIKGFLFYYGVVPDTKVYDMINSYMKEPLDTMTIFNIIYENTELVPGVNLEDTYWCSTEVENLKELIAEHKKLKNLDYLPLSEKQVLAGASDDFVDLNEFDNNLISFLYNNFDISKDEAIEYIDIIKFDFKIGCDYNEVIKDFSLNFQVEDLDMLHQAIELITSVYNNSTQWFLKGHSPNQISNTKKFLTKSTKNKRQ